MAAPRGAPGGSTLRHAGIAFGLALLLFATTPAAPVAPELVIYAEAEGHFRAGFVVLAVPGADDPANLTGDGNSVSIPLIVNGCHRRLVFDLVFDPDRIAVDDGDGTYAAIRYEYRVDLLDADGEPVRSMPMTESGYSRPLGTLPEGGVYRVDVTMISGAASDWWFRVRGFPEHGDAACADRVVISEVEANPTGRDHDREWVELHNPGLFPVDVTGWTIRALHGDPEILTIADRITLAPGESTIVSFPGQFLDNAEEVVVLEDPSGTAHDRTPALTDRQNDARTWQLVEGAWVFRDGTPGAV